MIYARPCVQFHNYMAIFLHQVPVETAFFYIVIISVIKLQSAAIELVFFSFIHLLIFLYKVQFLHGKYETIFQCVTFHSILK